MESGSLAGECLGMRGSFEAWVMGGFETLSGQKVDEVG